MAPVLGLLQIPPKGQFSAASLHWSSNDTAFIPASSLQDFVDGEGRSNLHVETTFYIRTSKNCDEQNSIWSKYIIYWCAYGPKFILDCKPATPPAKGTYPDKKEGSCPNACKANFNNHLKRGYQCHFIARVRKEDPTVVEIKYQYRKHCNKDGHQCHGTPENDEITRTWGTKCITAPRLTRAVLTHLEDLLRAGWSVLHTFDFHIRNQFERDGLDREPSAFDCLLTEDGRDDLITKKDLYNIKARVDKEEYQWDGDDQTSVNKWVAHYPERVLVHQEYKRGPPEQIFMLGLQSQWQLRQMIKLSHGSVLAMDNTFATNKYGFPFFTLVCFDKHDMGLPAAWCIQQTETAEQIAIFLQAVKERACAIKPDWKPSCFIIDCATAEVSAIQQVFPGVPIYFCLWHVRRAWKENLITHVLNRAKLLDMSDDLGDLMYAESEDDMYTAWEAFKATYATEASYLKYFQNTWMDRPEKWMRALRTMPRCNQNTNGVVEAWHGTLKRMILRKMGWLQGRRLDRLIHEIFTTMLPFFWYQVRAKQLGRTINYKKQEIVINSLHKAMHNIRDSQISFPNPDRPNQASFQSRKPNKCGYIIHNIYSNLPSCDCKWVDQGNMCKHQLKALLIKGHSGGDLVQRLGTHFGSQYDSLADLDQSTQPHTAEQQPTDSPTPANEEINEAECPEQIGVEQEHSDLPPEHDNVTDPEKMTIAAVRGLSADILAKVGDDPELIQRSFIDAQLSLNKIRQLSLAKDFTGKEKSSTIDTFVRLLGMTTQRRLGVIDKYHGARRGKRVVAISKRTRKGKRKQSGDAEVQQQEGHPQQDQGTPVDKYPPNSEIRRESIRQHLARLGEDFREGKKSRRTKKTKLVNPPSRVRNLGSLAIEGTAHRDDDIDINRKIVDSDNVLDLNVHIPEVEGIYLASTNLGENMVH